MPVNTESNLNPTYAPLNSNVYCTTVFPALTAFAAALTRAHDFPIPAGATNTPNSPGPNPPYPYTHDLNLYLHQPSLHRLSYV